MTTEIGLHFPRQYLERGTLANAVGAHQSQDLTGTGHGQSMQFEAVGSVAMGGVLLQILGQIDDVDGLKGTLLDADTAPDAQWFGEVGDLGLGPDLDAEFAQFDDGTGLFAFLFAFFGFALFGVDDGYAGEAVARVGGGGFGFFGGHLLSE